MGFRDEREANVLRVAELERQLALLRAGEIDDLRKRITELTRERERLMRGLDARSRARHRRVGAVLGAVVVVALGAGAFSWQTARRAERIQRAELARARDDVAELEAAAWSTHTQLAEAQRELAHIDRVHADDLSRLRQELGRSRSPGDGLQLTAHIQSRSGAVPIGVGDDCIMTIHSVTHVPNGRCVATVWCGLQRVYPASGAASTDLYCAIDASAVLAYAHAQGEAGLPALHYDAASGTLDVRDAPSGLALQMHVDRMLPYSFR